MPTLPSPSQTTNPPHPHAPRQPPQATQSNRPPSPAHVRQRSEELVERFGDWRFEDHAKFALRILAERERYGARQLGKLFTHATSKAGLEVEKEVGAEELGVEARRVDISRRGTPGAERNSYLEWRQKGGGAPPTFKQHAALVERLGGNPTRILEVRCLEECGRSLCNAAGLL